MRNDECTIVMTARSGLTVKFRRDSGRGRKDGKDWVQTASTGRTFRMTAEQVLSHLLPPLAEKEEGAKGAKTRGITVRVVHDATNGKKKGGRS